MARKFEELCGEFSYEKCVFGTDDDRTIIGLLEDKTTIKGKAREGDLEAGMTYRFYGYWFHHEKFGKQFAFHSFVVAQPLGKRGTVAYLQRGPGIGRRRAEQIWEAFGPGSLEVLRTKPDEVAAKINGLTPEKAREAAAFFQGHVDLEATTVALTELLGGLGTPRNLPERLIGKFGARAAEIVRENAFVLMLFRGCGYLRADRLYLQLGGDPTASERLGWCAWHALHSDTEGHTWRSMEVAERAIVKSVEGGQTRPGDGVKWAVDNEKIAVKQDEHGRTWVSEGARAGAERRLASHVHRAMVEGAAEGAAA